MKVLVAGTEPVVLRAAASLAAHPDVAQIGLADANPPSGWGDRMVRAKTSRGYDLIVGRAHRTLRSITADGTGAVTHASPWGLARALAGGLGPGAVAALTVPGRSRRSPAFFDFPAPVGRLLGSPDEAGVLVCPDDGELAAAGGHNGNRTVAVVDHPAFLEGVCLAAGALLGAHRGPVWDSAEQYLSACEELGLVRAEAG